MAFYYNIILVSINNILHILCACMTMTRCLPWSSKCRCFENVGHTTNAGRAWTWTPRSHSLSSIFLRHTVELCRRPCTDTCFGRNNIITIVALWAWVRMIWQTSETKEPVLTQPLDKHEKYREILYTILNSNAQQLLANSFKLSNVASCG